MFSFRKSFAVLAGLALIVGLAALFTPTSTQGQGKSGNAPPARDVIVVNTPLPVTGTVSVSNLGSNPLPVRDVDNPARQPFQATLEEPPVGAPPRVVTVPAGKRLVIEYVSANVIAGDLQCGAPPRYALTTTAAGVAQAHFFYPEFTGNVGSAGNVSRRYGLSQQTRIYADPNTQLALDIGVDSFPVCSFLNLGIGESGLHISGHLVDMAQ